MAKKSAALVVLAKSRGSFGAWKCTEIVALTELKFFIKSLGRGISWSRCRGFFFSESVVVFLKDVER